MRYPNLIGGDWVASESGETITTRNPADNRETVGHVQESTNDDADRAIAAAAAAQADWAATPGPSRGSVLRGAARLLDERKDDLVETLVREEGKTRTEASGEVQRAIDIFYYYAGKAADLGGEVKGSSRPNTDLSVRQEPVGVVAAITPWNYPIAIPAWKVAPALAAGNAVVLKPAPLANGVAHDFARCLDDAGIPDGVFNVVTGSGSTVGDALVTDKRVDAVSFTGSKTVGDIVYRNAVLDQKRVQLEMGGKNPTVVTDSADIDEAVEIVGTGAFATTGQSCTACSRAIVLESVYDEFVDAITDYADGLEVGPGLDDPDMGPHVSEAELESTLDYVEVGRKDGATLETGGQRISDGEYAHGFFVEPTVLSNVEPDMRIAQEEVFGPVLAVLSVADFDEAIEVANGVEQGLSASVVTDDLTEAHRFVDEVDAGVIKANEKTTGLELHVPFGGMKASSSETYREQGDAGLDFYTITKTVYMNY